MTKLVWDETGKRFYETGLDRGVLYTESNVGVPWNGLTSLTENSTLTVQEMYYDGQKRFDIPLTADFSGTLKAYTYPEEFLECEGVVSIIAGMFATQQKPKTFGLSYRTVIGNDLEGETFGYKIHLLYNLTAVPQAVSFNTIGDSLDLIEFSWNLTAVPVAVQFGYRPTSHVIIDSRKVTPSVLATIESVLYGSVSSEATLPTVQELLVIIANGETTTITIIDNGNGTWSAVGPDSLITMVSDTEFRIDQANATFVDSNTYQISSS